MRRERLEEIYQLSKTSLPTIGPVPNAPELLRKCNRALFEMQKTFEGTGAYGLVIQHLRELRDEAQESIDAYDPRFYNPDEGDHDLR